jgi:2'-5' RNA ligase
MDDFRPLILTATPEPRAQAHFQAMRDRHFPPERNVVPAHLTLFHHLPGSQIDDIAGRLKSLARLTPPLDAEVAGIRSLGGGTAYDIRCDALDDVRAELAHAWSSLLIPQDRQGFRPHVTFQNKVSGKAATALRDALVPDFTPWRFRIPALTLWRYLGGPWERLRDFAFRGAD